MSVGKKSGLIPTSATEVQGNTLAAMPGMRNVIFYSIHKNVIAAIMNMLYD